MRRALLTAALALLLPAAAAAEPYVAIRGAPAPGPDVYDRVFVEKFGPASAKTVLVLVPGFGGGAGSFALVAPELVKRVPGLQVWAYDRREQALEDHTGFTAAEPQAALDYYFASKPVGGKTFRPPVVAKDFPFARRWGLALALEDLRRVVQTARAGGARTVVLGGHSFGAATAAAYAAWDFGGKPGYRDLAGLVLIDGGQLGAFEGLTLAEAKARLAKLVSGSPFEDQLGLGVPWIYGVFGQAGAQFAISDPTGVSVLQKNPLVPSSLSAPVPVTNQAFLGFAAQRTGISVGSLADAGDPRPWRDDGIARVADVARTLARESADCFEWYFPARLTIDLLGAQSLARVPVTDLLGLRVWHRAKVDVPLYAYETGAFKGRVLKGARRYLDASRIPRDRSVLAADRKTLHVDPLFAAPERNRFLQTLVPFLKRTIDRSARRSR